jgi:hypothetical protein
MTHTLRAAVLAALCLAAVPAANAAPILGLTSAPALTGAPGLKLSWGFSLSNDTGFDLYVTSVYADGSLYGTGGASALGTFADQIAQWTAGNGLVVNAGGSFTGNAPSQALASFQISPSATAGSLPVTGHIFLTYELYNSNLDFQGSGTLTAQYGGGDATASVAISAGGAVPEPGTAALVLLGLAALRARKAA